MLHITDAAAEAIAELTESAPGCAGMRITTVPQASTNGNGPTTIFDFYPADGPEDEDEIVEEQGIQIFLEAEVAPFLENKLLDAEIDGDEVRFTVEAQDGDADGAG